MYTDNKEVRKRGVTMKRKLWIFIGVFVVLLGGYFLLFREKSYKVEVEKVNPKIQRLMSTDKQHFLTKHEFHTKETAERKDVATGHELLSESSGLYLRNLAFDTQGRFDNFYKQTKDTFYDGVQFSYRIDEQGNKYNVNASIDDLRIIRSLIEAGGHFKTDQYDQEIKKLGKSFMKTSMKDNILIDFYDSKSKQQSSETSLFYIDLITLGYLYKEFGISADYLQYHYQLIDDGYISDDLPLYQTKFNHQTNKYENNGTLNIIESLLTIVHLSEVGMAKQTSIDFVRKQVQQGTLFNSYDLNGSPVDKNQSAASYAIAALIGVAENDKELYRAAITVLNNFQIMDSSSPIYGGFGDKVTKQVYSYNNLMALLAYDF
ncbi:TPA: hypothetical protein IU311_001475 [Enterococcus faecalis]|nr:hypothetical protein [Enterococcus faecalis]EKS9954485.1 hypothetical protein [Enterococcus faecalis]MBJ1693136.1 hypothetical protein [Enterococcus faecalis]MCV3142579.1 hypothetical protein [Enterococcus faecalis]MDJ9035877.1 hypothetical protein [Enterococcus faecalis]MDT2067996.1 hypothetical protein [Enterococcus faecalis]